jgi:hypothetical protein
MGGSPRHIHHDACLAGELRVHPDRAGSRISTFKKEFNHEKHERKEHELFSFVNPDRIQKQFVFPGEISIILRLFLAEHGTPGIFGVFNGILARGNTNRETF